MPHTLLIRLQAPMQAWGVQGLFSMRDTLREPTRSGVIGLLCAALGRDREHPLDDLYALRMGIRVDQEGTLMKDFHTARNILTASGTSWTNVISDRYYLADAVFLVGLECDDLALLTRFQEALKKPQWLLFLGRRAFPPAQPVWMQNGLRPGETLEKALSTYPFLLDSVRLETTQQLRILIEDPTGSILQRDMPRSFMRREYLPRTLRMGTIDKPASCIEESSNVS